MCSNRAISRMMAKWVKNRSVVRRAVIFLLRTNRASAVGNASRVPGSACRERATAARRESWPTCCPSAAGPSAMLPVAFDRRARREPGDRPGFGRLRLCRLSRVDRAALCARAALDAGIELIEHRRQVVDDAL